MPDLLVEAFFAVPLREEVDFFAPLLAERPFDAVVLALERDDDVAVLEDRPLGAAFFLATPVREDARLVVALLLPEELLLPEADDLFAVLLEREEDDFVAVLRLGAAARLVVAFLDTPERENGDLFAAPLERVEDDFLATPLFDEVDRLAVLLLFVAVLRLGLVSPI